MIMKVRKSQSISPTEENKGLQFGVENPQALHLQKDNQDFQPRTLVPPNDSELSHAL
jgi:hypothetical protein